MLVDLESEEDRARSGTSDTPALQPPFAEALFPSAPGDLPTRPAMLRSEVAQALRANLTRGYLESEERFRQIAEALSDVVSLMDADRRRLYFVNTAYERIWGRPREPLYVDPTAFLDAVHPEDVLRVRDQMVRNSRGDCNLEFRVVRPDGEVRWVWARGFPVRNSDGEVYRVATVIEDITERKTIADSHERFLRGFTHDVKNPLGVADGSLALLEMGISGDLNPEQMEHVARARRSIRTALNLVFQLLEIQRAAAGELHVDRMPVDVGEILRECVEDFRAAANTKRQALALQVDCDREDLMIESDRPRVRQILANLVSNAVKYTQSGGRILVSARTAGEDEGAAPRRGHWLRVDVADDGPGIPPQKLGLLFHEFTRFTPGAAEGTGLGLAISQHLAWALGAAITVRSELRVGSTFTLWLPHDPSGRDGE